MFGNSGSLWSCYTYQFEDYTKLVADRFDPEEEDRRRRKVFPLDCKKALAIMFEIAQKPV